MADDAETESQSDRDGSDGSESAAEPADGDESTDSDRPVDDEPAEGDDPSSDRPSPDDANADEADGDDTDTDDEGDSAEGDDGSEDGSDEHLEADDLVGAGEYVGNTDDGETVDRDGETVDRDGETADRDGETADRDGETVGRDGESAPSPPAETTDGEAPIPADGDAPAPPDHDERSPPDVDQRPPSDLDEHPSPELDRPARDPEVYTPDSGESGFTEGPRQAPEEYERPDNMAEATPIQRKTGPPEDQEMPLADHVEEMISRLFIIIAIAGVVSVAIFPFGEEIIDFLWFSILPGGNVAQPRVYHPLALVMTQLKVASLGGLIVALPVFVYQTYAFMKPGLYPNERRYYLAAIPTSLVLAFVGVTFAFYVILPIIFTYFLYYSDTVVTIAFALSDTFNLILLLMGYLAIVFQIPLFIMLAIMMGLVTRRWLENRRLYFWAAFLGISFLFNPDPTGMAPFLVTATMIFLFEGTLLLLRWTGR